MANPLYGVTLRCMTVLYVVGGVLGGLVPFAALVWFGWAADKKHPS